MKRIRCPYCKNLIQIPTKLIQKSLQSGTQLAFICPNCKRQLKANITPKTNQETTQDDNTLATLTILEGDFCYRQEFPLSNGLYHIGRKNTGSEVEIPIVTSDPSMDRHHCIIEIILKADNLVEAYLKDDDSLVGTFLNGSLLQPKDKIKLQDGNIITLGATNVIFHYNNKTYCDEPSIGR